MAIHNRHDFQAFFGHDECRIAEAFFFIQRAFVANLVGDVRQNPKQNLVAAPSLNASMHRIVVRTAFARVPLRTRVEDPQHRFQQMTGRNWLGSRTPIGNMLLRKMLPNALHCSSVSQIIPYSGSTAAGNFEIASSSSAQETALRICGPAASAPLPSGSATTITPSSARCSGIRGAAVPQHVQILSHI
jgi:hypothetical protein